MLYRPSRLIPLIAALTLVAARLHAQGEPSDPSIAVDPNHNNGVYALGESVTWTVNFPKAPPTGLHWAVKANNNKVLSEGDFTNDNRIQTVTAKLDEPGWLFLSITGPDRNALVASGGALFAPAEITRSSEAPADFQAFWNAQLEALVKIPPNPTIFRGDSGAQGVAEYYDVTLDNVDGTHVRAQLARPTHGEKFPAIVIYQWAGVYPLPKSNVVDRAKEGWLALNVMAHDLPLHESEGYYRNLKLPSGEPFSNYASVGREKRETSYFRRMLLGDYQAIEYLKSRPDWDGRVLVVRGASQGGLQSVAMAALQPSVTHLMVTAPAGCDTLSLEKSRMPGWPYWHTFGDSESVAKSLQTSRYYDPANFAPLVKCPATVAAGLRDTTAPPPNVLAMFHALGGPAELVLMPRATHQRDQNEAYTRANEWLATLVKTGKSPELKSDVAK